MVKKSVKFDPRIYSTGCEISKNTTNKSLLKFIDSFLIAYKGFGDYTLQEEEIELYHVLNYLTNETFVEMVGLYGRFLRMVFILFITKLGVKSLTLLSI